jgi:hypothetical protein
MPNRRKESKPHEKLPNDVSKVRQVKGMIPRNNFGPQSAE